MEQLGADHISIKIVQKRLYHAYLGVLRHELLLQQHQLFIHLTGILRDIRDTHRKDATTADENCAALEVQKQLQDAMDYKGSTEEKKARLFLANLGIDYDALTMEQFANLIEVLKLSKHMNSPISQRGKGSMTHGKGKRKRK